MDHPNMGEQETSKRLSSIESILNPTGTSSDRSAQITRTNTANLGISAPPSHAGTSRTTTGDAERQKAEKRAALQREAEMMRELLAAKERELAELEN
jgi:hypothetical protein